MRMMFKKTDGIKNQIDLLKIPRDQASSMDYVVAEISASRLTRSLILVLALIAMPWAAFAQERSAASPKPHAFANLVRERGPQVTLALADAALAVTAGDAILTSVPLIDILDAGSDLDYAKRYLAKDLGLAPDHPHVVAKIRQHREQQRLQLQEAKSYFKSRSGAATTALLFWGTADYALRVLNPRKLEVSPSVSFLMRKAGQAADALKTDAPAVVRNGK